MKLLKYLCALMAVLSMIVMAACSNQNEPSAQAPTAISPSSSVNPSAAPTATVDTAVPAPTETPQATAAPLSETDLSFTLNGVAYKLKTDAKPLLDAIGPDYALDKAPSCLYVGEDKTFTYTDVKIVTFPQGDKDIMDEIDLVTDKYATSRGIKVGDTPEQVKAAYGNNCTDDGVLVTYYLSGTLSDLKSPQLYFQVENGKVTLIGYYSASNIQ